MRLLRFVVEGYRSLQRVEWSPGDLTVVTGPGARDLMDAARLYARLHQGWGLFAEAVEAERARPSPPWHPEAVEFRLYAKCAAHPDRELDFDHEAIVERLDGRPWWCVGYERSTLSNDFDDELVLDRMGDRVEYVPAKKVMPGTPIAQKQKSEIHRVAGDMPVFGAVQSVRRDPRIADHLEAIAAWSLHGPLSVAPDSPLRLPTAPFGFAGALSEDASNLINLLSNVCDWFEAKKRFEAAMRDVIPGFDALVFRTVDDIALAMALRTRDGETTPHAELPDSTLRALAVYGMLVSPEAPPLLWLDAPHEGLDPWAGLPLADFALEAARSTRVVISSPSEALARRLDEVARSPGETRDGRALTVTRYHAE